MLAWIGAFRHLHQPSRPGSGVGGKNSLVLPQLVAYLADN